MMKKLKMRINLVDEVDKVDSKFERREQYIWFLLVPLLP